ncbi:MAG TPA: hypothetical protein VGW38_07310 [Chloroflexota bacterium]|nr:hypothetical protein [Chloroflexota bacterium]
MRLFATPAVKELKQQSEFIGGMHGQVHLGRLSRNDLVDVIQHQGFRSRLRAAYDAAVADVGEEKALKAAISAARIQAEAYARLGERNYGDVPPAAERSIREMLGLGQ